VDQQRAAYVALAHELLARRAEDLVVALLHVIRALCGHAFERVFARLHGLSLRFNVDAQPFDRRRLVLWFGLLGHNRLLPHSGA